MVGIEMAVATVRDNPFAIELQNLLQKGIAQARRNNRPTLVSVTERIWQIDPIVLFDNSQHTDRFFWAQPGEDFALAGFGAAQVIDAVGASRFRQTAKARQQVLTGAIIEGSRGLPGAGPLFLGGFSFDPDYASNWQDYPDGRMVLPQLLFTFSHSDAWLTFNAIVQPTSDADAETAELVDMYTTLMAANTRHSRTNGASAKAGDVTLRELRSADEWQAEVAGVAQTIREGSLEKAVLARAVKLESSKPINIAQALRRLTTSYVGCYVFAFAHGDSCFLGATPERLIRLQHGEILTMSLAGSIRRGETFEEDAQMGAALLASTKDRYEHAVVVKALVEALSPTSNNLQVEPSPSLLRLGNVQHLCTPIKGKVNNGYTLLDLVERLHPTPAVGGRPRQKALQLIHDREKLDRGWYAGPIGWIDAKGEGEFAVAIRSALVNGSEATLFAGCGIMADSDPEKEYAESVLKLKPMLSALTG
jgi:isochorismate synthase